MPKNNQTRSKDLQPAARPEPAAQPGMVRFLWSFPIYLAAGFGLLLAPFSRPFVDASTTILVKICAFAVRAFGGSALARGNALINPASGFTISVEDTCNASNVIILLGAAVLAFPARWGHRAKGFLAGAVVLHIVNFFRIVSLFYLAQYNYAWFEFAHWYVWEGLMMIVTLVLFWIWVQYSREEPPAVSEGA